MGAPTIDFERLFKLRLAVAQARIVFEIANSRCHELFDPPGCMTLWSLPAVLVKSQEFTHLSCRSRRAEITAECARPVAGGSRARRGKKGVK